MLIVKKGDTLIEVTLAVGIFSMIAVAVVAVMSGGISGAQTALETTLAREEIDAQAEAIRFIHSSYVADKGAGNQKYANLWKAITKNATDFKGTSSEEKKSKIIKYAPKTCAELYSGDNSIFNQKAFIIDTRALNNPSDASKVILTSNSVLKQASIYPRLVFGTNNNDESSSSGGLINRDEEKNSLIYAEGIYIVAVRDDSTTSIVGDQAETSKASAFYDFYIRTCWYGSDAEEPSTISTVMRLYDPDSIDSSSKT